jgi:SAM-dependent methyltransferase
MRHRVLPELATIAGLLEAPTSKDEGSYANLLCLRGEAPEGELIPLLRRTAVDDPLYKLQKAWDRLGRVDPLYTILTDLHKRGGKWNLRAFFETGERGIAGVIRYVDSLGLNLRRSTALDFGCGVGRLMQALALDFRTVWGVDIAPSMIEQAKRYNRYGDRCIYPVNYADGLSAFQDETFDFIYSVLTLQHMDPALSEKYIREFVRVLSPGGLMIFQLPGELKPRAFRWYERILSKAVLDAHLRVRDRACQIMRCTDARE